MKGSPAKMGTIQGTASYASALKQEQEVVGREGETYVIDKMAVVNDPVRNTEQFSDKPMYEGQGYSTHLMTSGSTGDPENPKYHAWPTLFQDEGGNWYKGDFKEAKRKGELYDFDTEEEARAFAGGNWKDKHFNK